MFFLVRCIFWLSVVYFNLPDGQRAGIDAGRFLDMASAHVGSFSRARSDAVVHSDTAALGAGVVQTLAENGADWCRTHGEACADAVLAAMVAKTPPAETKPAVDTLTPADRASHWHGAPARPRKS